MHRIPGSFRQAVASPFVVIRKHASRERVRTMLALRDQFRRHESRIGRGVRPDEGAMVVGLGAPPGGKADGEAGQQRQSG